jgi:Ni,Fe-hydrogenase III large subunit
MSTDRLPSIRNGEAIDSAEVPVLGTAAFRDAVLDGVRKGQRIAALFGLPGGDAPVRLYCVLADGAQGILRLVANDVRGKYPALTVDCPPARRFEMEIAEQCSLLPEGHPWLKPVRYERAAEPAVTDFFQVTGAEVHEVAVGPVHAGVIEPGHFRFQCHGETILHLETALGFQHRGVERALTGGPSKRSLHYAETLSGDATVGHALAYCTVLEALSDSAVPPRAQVLRGIGLELERLANHTGDLGGLATDVGYLPTASFCGRLRGDFLNLSALLCGSRFGRGLVRPGGTGFDLDPKRTGELRQRLAAAFQDVSGAVDLLWTTPSVMGRFEGSGQMSPEAWLSAETCIDIGVVGPAARSCGVPRDVRTEFPAGAFATWPIAVSTSPSSDVFARARVRWMEIQRSLEWIQARLDGFPEGDIVAAQKPLASNRIAVSLVEGWRGEICHVAITDTKGRFRRYKVVDPSFHNWFALALVMRGQPISDFPLNNKSFSLSYCGHDL